ncbi:MAG TPA: hypothetical protein VMT16_02795 [Thermoanaerobaculia bacterium]|nr:hypothetical protein [Thermoanaerobaculia bacterium]
MSERSPLVDQVLSGGNRQLTLLAARGMLPLPPEQLLSLQVGLACWEDEEVAETARESLGAVDNRLLLPYLEQQASPEVLHWFATHSGDSEVLERLLRRRDVPTGVLMDLAPRLPANLQEVLLLRQDRIVAEPEILEALAGNPQLSGYSQRRIGEYRQHLLAGPGAAVEEEAPRVEEGEVGPGLEDPEVQAALAAARAQPVEGEIDIETGLSEGQIRLLPVPVRLRLARGAHRNLRALLIRDSASQVALAVLRSNPISDMEAEHFARSRLVLEDVLEAIAGNRRWAGKYPIVVALASNPRTPIAIALRLVPRLSVRDLRILARDRNVSEAVRSNALRLYRVKSR